MEFIDHTINWTKGEILEATIMGIVGLLILIAGVLFWKYGNTPYAKAMIWPILITGLLLAVMGIYGVIYNKNRIKVYQQKWEQNPTEFVQSEKARVENFDNIFKYSYPAMVTMVVAGAILFFVFKNPNAKAICLALMLLGLAGYFIDHFAAERGEIYYKEIIKFSTKL